MDLRQLECFMAVCEELHFSRAAEKLYMSQPSLCQQIKNLEAQIGTPLFDRIGRKIAITESGKILYEHAERIFDEMERAKSEINDLSVLQRGNLTIGALLTCVSYLLPQTILKFKEMHPNITLSVLGLGTEDIRSRLQENELDIGIVSLPIRDKEIESIPLYTEKLSLAVPLSHPFADFEEIDMKDLNDAPTIVLPESYALRALVDQYCAELGIALKPVLKLSTMESVIQMVSEGVGVAILPEPYIDYVNNAQIKKVKLVNPTPEREIGFIYREDKFMCATTRSFMNQLIKMDTE